MNFLATSTRLRSLDLLRGVVCVLMAIDHVRVFSGIPAGGPTPGIFFTRWVTHFVAPAFCLLAGTAAYLHGRKLADPGALARFLVTRGLFLVILELTVIRFTWTFNLDYSQFMLAGVIWMLGWCMVLLAAFVRLPAGTAGLIGLALIFGQQLLALVPQVLPESMRAPFGLFWEFIYSSGLEGPSFIAILYVIVPWIGVMLAGYGMGPIMEWAPDRRRRLFLRVGLGATAVFLVVAVGAALLREAPANAPPLFVRVLAQQKYPASQLFLLMTLGPMIALLPAAERARGFLADAFVTIGRVPMFYYLLHIPAIHLAGLLVNLLRTGAAHQEWYETAPYASVPPDQRWSLTLLYLVFTVVVVGVLFPACRWFAQLKARRKETWLSYL